VVTKDRSPRIAETVAARIWWSPGAVSSTSGTANGVRMAIVPQEVPVAKDTAAATRKTAIGKISGGKLGPTAPLRKPAVPRSLHT